MLALHLDILNAYRSPNADSPQRDRLITMVKVKKKEMLTEFNGLEKWET